MDENEWVHGNMGLMLGLMSFSFFEKIDKNNVAFPRIKISVKHRFIIFHIF